MKAVRIPLATALIVVVVALNGCDLFFGTEPGPSAPRFDPPAGTHSEHLWVSIKNSEGQLYVTTDPNLEVLQFEPTSDRESIFVGDDLTIRAYVLDDNGVRSAIAEAVYIIEDATAPVISSTAIWQTSVDYFGYEIRWDAWPPDGSNGSNPSDDLTDWRDLEFAVYASPADDIDTLDDAESNGTLLRDWFSRRDVEESWNDGDPGNDLEDVGYAHWTAAYAGERRYVNVFVRDMEGNVSAYGSVGMESRVGPDVVTDAQPWLNPQDGGLDPQFSVVGAPPADVAVSHVVALVDMDDDGVDDLVTCYYDWEPVTGTHQAWFRSLGNGGFDDAPHYFQQNSEVATDIGIADINRDGSREIILSNASAVVVYAEAGEPPVASISLPSVDTFAVGDINGDGYPDIVTGDADAMVDDVLVWINDRNDGFTNIGQSWGLDNPSPIDLLVADLSKDGFADLVVANSSPPDVPVQVYYGSGDGTLDPYALGEPWPITYTEKLGAADWNRDGWPDLIFSNSPGSIQVYLNNQDGSYPGAPDIAQPSGGSPTTGIAIGDFNDDGYPDFVETFDSGNAIVWMNTGGTGIFQGSAFLGTGANGAAIGRLR